MGRITLIPAFVAFPLVGSFVDVGASIVPAVAFLTTLTMVGVVIFLLTVVIEALIPKEWIIKHFGEKSGFLGNIFSLILGSISAGPIYAAFPISKMLLSKGASVSNIVIILSSWAVIKLPMLANEVKFLGVTFMGIRWGLNVVAILIMAWLTGKLIDRKELLSHAAINLKPNVHVNSDYCIGCGICEKMLPEVYEIIDQNAYASFENVNPGNMIMLHKTVEKCPTQAISFEGA